MRKLLKSIPIALLLPCGILSTLLTISSPVQALEAGAAKVDITPAPGVPLNGFGDRMGRSATAVHDTLWVRSLYLSDGETSLFLITTDLCLINSALRTRVLELAPDIVPAEHIILTATHTHNGPGGMEERIPYRMVSGRYIPALLDEIAGKIAASMIQAYEARQRATVGYGIAKQGVLSKNRRDTNGIVDEQIGVIKVDDADGLSIAIVANMAAHPTSVPESHHYAFSADYPGYYYTALESLANPECVAMFVNGAEGNQTIASPEGTAGWARTEAVGTLLAGRVKEVANRIAGREVKLRVGYAAPELPLSIADGIQPRTTVLQTLEIDDLAISFFPGEPCVELGLKLRQYALSAGYNMHFSVGLANDYLGYFVPRDQYSRFQYETAMNFYGPGIEDWLYENFLSLHTKATPIGPGDSGAVPPQSETGGFLVLDGGSEPFERGLVRGKLLAQDIRERYEQRIVAPLRSREWGPDTGAWQYWPGFMDRSALALPALAISARPRLTGSPIDLIRELEGMAQGAGLPFDAVWLLNNADEIRLQPSHDALFNTPLCTMFAVIGTKAGADGLIVGRNLDWSAPETPVITRYTAATGKSVLQVGFSWNAGIFTGMNSDGVVLCLSRVPSRGTPGWNNPPAAMVIRNVLEHAGNLDDAIKLLSADGMPPGYHILAAGISGEAWQASVVEWTENGTQVRVAADGLLLGEEPESASASADARQRYIQVRRALGAERIAGIGEVEEVLLTGDRGEENLDLVFNGHTQHSVVFLPDQGLIRVRAPEMADANFSSLEVGSTN